MTKYILYFLKWSATNFTPTIRMTHFDQFSFCKNRKSQRQSDDFVKDNIFINLIVFKNSAERRELSAIESKVSFTL
jgi:hypothetical protein